MAFLLRENMPNAYKEVYEILKYVRKEDRDAIPNDFMEIIERKMNKEYRYIYDYTKSFEEHVMLQETKAILGYIYLTFKPFKTPLFFDKKSKTYGINKNI